MWGIDFVCSVGLGFFQARDAVCMVASTVAALIQPDSKLFSLTAEGCLGFKLS